MSTLEFSLGQARTLLLAAQGLIETPRSKPDGLAVLETIRTMGVLQIDTIHVVARSPYLVLWSRLGDYDPHLLDRLLAEGKLFEYWSHEACFIPVEQYPLYRRIMLERRSKAGRWKFVEYKPDPARKVLDFVAERGEARSSDFKRTDGKSGNWWDWKEEKVALECLHMSGDLMIARRERFQRVYALREKVMPRWSDDDAPAYREVARALTEASVRCLGVAPEKLVADYFRLLKRPVAAALQDLAREGRILEAKIEGIPGSAYVHRSNLDTANSVVSGAIKAKRTVLLSPFDPVVWDRERARTLFDFDYTIECYTPAPKRRYGYYSLPILHRDRLVGRLDAKAHRRDKLFEVKALFLEPQVGVDDELIEAIGGALRDCARWHHTPKVRIVSTEPRGLARRIQGAANRKGTSSLRLEVPIG